MYCVVYRFIVKEGQEKQFVASWSAVTKAFRNTCGALGSRLHFHENQEYIAYAQWPSKEVRDAAELPQEVKESSFAEMRTACDSIEVLFELTPVSDLLVHQSHR
jgi:hypothetical protein